MTTHSTFVGYVLWLFGFMGVHRFYYGKRTTGALYAATLGLFGIGWVVDLFLIPGMKREVHGRYQPGRYNYSIAWLLLLGLGWLGVHRFYIGKWKSGLLYLLTLGLLGIGWIYDLFVLNEVLSEVNETWISGEQPTGKSRRAPAERLSVP